MAEDAATKETQSATLVGVGGWLLIFIIRLLLVVAADALQLSMGTFGWAVRSVTVALASLAGVAAFLLICGKRTGVIVGKLSMLADAALTLFGAVAGFIGGADNSGRAFAACLVDIAFFFYLGQSMRVRNTYFTKMNPTLDEPH